VPIFLYYAIDIRNTIDFKDYLILNTVWMAQSVCLFNEVTCDHRYFVDAVHSNITRKYIGTMAFFIP
jgi:hypothetical protein